MKDRLPKVLVISINVWRDDSHIRTLPELFSCWDRDRVAQIYTRAGVPSNSICDRYFRIDENSVIKSIFNRRLKTGTVVENQNGELCPDEQARLDAENARYAAAHRKHSWFMTLCREAVWRFGKWKTKELDEFIRDFDPDVLFVPVYPFYYMERIQSYIIKKTGKPVVCFLADDNYTYLPCGNNPLSYLHRFILRGYVRRVMRHCKELFVMTPKAKEEYDRFFSTDSRILTKAVDFSHIHYEEKPIHTPIRMVYTGKLVIGRDKALAQIADALREINKDELRLTLDIYSPDTPHHRLLPMFGAPGCRLCGAVPKDEVAQIQAQADIVIFAESLDRKYRNAARLSFSTKLTDYFASGKCIFALGSRDIAPIDYLIREDAAVVVTEYSQIGKTLSKLCAEPQQITEYGRKAFDCGKRNHDADTVYSQFKAVISEASRI